MTSLRIDSLCIDEHIEDKISQKHRVTFDECEEVVFSSRRHVRRAAEGFVKVFGQTYGGRYLLVIIVRRDAERWFVATARDMTNSERRLFQRWTKA